MGWADARLLLTMPAHRLCNFHSNPIAKIPPQSGQCNDQEAVTGAQPAARRGRARGFVLGRGATTRSAHFCAGVYRHRGCVFVPERSGEHGLSDQKAEHYVPSGASAISRGTSAGTRQRHLAETAQPQRSHSAPSGAQATILPSSTFDRSFCQR